MELGSGRLRVKEKDMSLLVPPVADERDVLQVPQYLAAYMDES